MSVRLLALLLASTMIFNGCSIEDILSKNVVATEIKIPDEPIDDFSQYSLLNGVFTFRGNDTRTAPSFGTVNIKENKFEKLWSVTLKGGGPTWGGGVGWTGQPALIQWPEETKAIMNIDKKYVDDEEFVEVIQASLNGNIYFFDLATGEPTRKPIELKDPIKGSVSVDSRGWPMMYVGQGIKESNELGFYIISLIDQSILFFQNGADSAAPRSWPAFDSSAIFDREKDRLIVGGENGLVYRVDLNTVFDPDLGTIKISPKVNRYKYQSPGAGIENSLAKYKDNVYFGDNGGMVTGLNIETMEKLWTYSNLDDIDASTMLDIVNDVPYIYSICQVDKQGNPGISRIVKLNALTGEVMWKVDHKTFSRYGASPSNGGGLGSPILGKGDMEGLVIFSICRTPTFDTGYLVAYDKETGKEVWGKKMPMYNWPSPVDVYDDNDKGYVIQVERNGFLSLHDGKTGRELNRTKLESTYMEASPAVFNDKIVFSSRDGKVYCYKIK